jgi:hypothetical protein
MYGPLTQEPEDAVIDFINLLIEANPLLAEQRRRQQEFWKEFAILAYACHMSKEKENCD